MYKRIALFIVTFHISYCSGFAGYEMFHGFDVTTLTNAMQTTPRAFHSTSLSKKKETTLKTLGTTFTKGTPNVPLETHTVPSVLPLKFSMFNCSEDEKPFNIGAYEVPTQRDLVLLIQKTLIRMFNSYQEKALEFLQDIGAATKASSDVEKKCYNHDNNHLNYKMCVRQISKKCQVITKSLVTSLERQRLDVSAFIEGTICNVTEMKADPLQLIKTLAKEQASLEFALPSFLRLLGACSSYCIKRPFEKNRWRPLRHLTDQDLVVKHFLTKKNYLQLIKGSN